jgi:Lrp/AsnC family transcriptional regulator
VKIDSKDKLLLKRLQTNADVTVAELADEVSLSVNACWRRVQRLQEVYMVRKVAILDAAKLGLGLITFVSVKTNQHNDEWLGGFAKGVSRIDEVTEFYRLSGETDYLLKVVVSDVTDYDRVYKKIISAAPLSDVSSSFVMETIKATTALPI